MLGRLVSGESLPVLLVQTVVCKLRGGLFCNHPFVFCNHPFVFGNHLKRGGMGFLQYLELAVGREGG